VVSQAIPCLWMGQHRLPWTNFSVQDEPWAELSTLEVAA